MYLGFRCPSSSILPEYRALARPESQLDLAPIPVPCFKTFFGHSRAKRLPSQIQQPVNGALPLALARGLTTIPVPIFALALAIAFKAFLLLPLPHG